MHKLALVTALLLTSIACEHPAISQPDAKQVQANRAQQEANNLSFAENAEIDNIKRRLELTADPGAMGFILLLNEAGQPIYYASVKGKITSGGKRLTRPWDWSKKCNYADPTCLQVTTAPSDEGTWGSSSPYIYFWTQSGQYMQWSGDYLYSDKPFRLQVEPLVVDIVED